MWIAARWSIRFCGYYHVNRVESAGALEGRTTSQHFIENGAQGVDVGAWANFLGLAGGLLRGHVAGRAENVASARVGRTAFQTLGKSEIGDLGDAVGERGV